MLVLTQLLGAMVCLMLLVAIVWLFVNELCRGWKPEKVQEVQHLGSATFGGRIVRSLRDSSLLPWWLYALSFFVAAAAALVDAVVEPEVDVHRLMVILSTTTGLSFLLGFITEHRTRVFLVRLAFSPFYFVLVQKITGWSCMAQFEVWDFLTLSLYTDVLLGSLPAQAGGGVAAMWIYQELASAGLAKRDYTVCSLGFFVCSRFMLYCHEASGAEQFLFFAVFCGVMGAVMLLMAVSSFIRRLRGLSVVRPPGATDLAEPDRPIDSPLAD